MTPQEKIAEVLSNAKTNKDLYRHMENEYMNNAIMGHTHRKEDLMKEEVGDAGVAQRIRNEASLIDSLVREAASLDDIMTTIDTLKCKLLSAATYGDPELLKALKMLNKLAGHIEESLLLD